MSDKSNPYSAPDTGHVWDDNLRELTNQPPKWWMLGLHASWIFVVLYSILYPTWPMINTHTKGIMGWTSIQEFKDGMAVVEEKRSVYEDQLKGKSAAAILADDELSRYVKASSKVLFGDNCAACHGASGQGNPNFPRLSNDDWLWGGTVQAIETSISRGRSGVMPGHGHLSDGQIDELANAIVAGNPTATPLYASTGCIACHGADGKGNHLMGSVNLTNGIWRFESSDQLASVKQTIRHGVNVGGSSREAIMPAFADRLSKDDITKLTVYVHSLGGGQ